VPTDIENLPDDISALKDLVVSYDQDARILREKIRHLEGLLYARKSERHTVDPSVQPSLFDEAEDVAEESPEPEVPVPAHTRRKRGRRPIPEELPREDVVHDLPDGEKVCACGCALTKIGEEVSEKLDVIPPRMRVLRHVRYKYACRCCEGVEENRGAVLTAPMPPQVIPQGIATPGLLAYVLTSKYADALPLYRQEKIFERIGVDLSRSTMASWVVQVGQKLDPLMDLAQRVLLSSPLVGIDETRVQVMKEPGRADTSLSYMWVFRGDSRDGPVVMFQYQPSRSGSVASSFLGDYSGTVQVDGYAGYNALEAGGSVRLAGCWAHVRRKFVEAARAAKGTGKTGSADVAISMIKNLYAIERRGSDAELNAEALRDLRQEEARPIVEKFGSWLTKRQGETPPKGLLGKAIHYAIGQWPRLTVYLEDGHVRIDNNLVENAIRPFAVGRKNWLFSGHPRGARASANIYSVIETAKANGLEPYRYLRFLFERLPYAQTSDDLKALLPFHAPPDLPDLSN